MIRRHIPSFDFVIFRPVAETRFLFMAGNEGSPASTILASEAIFKMLNNAYERMAPRGEMLIEIQDSIPDVLMNSFLKKLQAEGAQIVTSPTSAFMVRKPRKID